jgi:predicted DNA-binding transcriptional regulator AlpA
MDKQFSPFERDLLSAEETSLRLGVSVDTFRSMVERHEFPPGIPISPKIEKWLLLDVLAYTHLRSRDPEFRRIQADPERSKRKTEASGEQPLK